VPKELEVEAVLLKRCNQDLECWMNDSKQAFRFVKLVSHLRCEVLKARQDLGKVLTHVDVFEDVLRMRKIRESFENMKQGHRIAVENPAQQGRCLVDS